MNDGDHPNVTATVVDEQCPGEHVQVRVCQPTEEARRLFTEEDDSRRKVYYEEPLNERDVRVRVFLVKLKTGGSESFAQFRSAGPPSPLE